MKFHAVAIALTLFACGKDKGGDKGGGGGGAAAGGPACSEAAAAYVKAHTDGGGNKIYALKPTPDEVKTITAKLEADCTSRPWSAAEKTCVVGIKNLLTDNKCFKGLQVAQVIHDTANAVQAARDAAGSAAGSAAAGSAEAGSAAGSAAAGSAAAGSGSGAGSSK